MDVVCTAGHVDHGKSALVTALTGMQPDRFAEEQERGLTIDLGFAWADLHATSGVRRTVAFVDLPGHERFVANMLAGAGAVEVALLVVAADEGWMRQTQEHTDILDLLGICRGLVALTKTDTVDPPTAAATAAVVRDRLASSALAEAEVVGVSARTGAGLAHLVDRLLALLAAAPPAPDLGRPRLWVDRSFTVHGAGTVVTGTLAGGDVAVGDELAVLPGRRPARVRGLQTLGQAVDVAARGSRVAINLAGVDRRHARRGDAVGRSGQWLAVQALEAQVRALPGMRITQRGAWHLHAGSGERLARVLPLRAPNPLHGDAEGLVRIELDRPVTLTAGDRFVLREAGRRVTAGGGLVLDPDPPPRPRGAAAREARAHALVARAVALRAGDRATLLAQAVSERGAEAVERLAAAAGLTVHQTDDAARQAGLLRLGAAYAAPEAAARWSAAVATALAEHHAAHPLDRTAPHDVAARAACAAGCPPTLAPALLDTLARLGRLVRQGSGLRLPSHAVRLDAGQAAARDALLAILGAQPLSPPRLGDAAVQAGAPAALVRELEAAGTIVRLGPDLALLADAVAVAVARLRDAYATEGPLTAGRAKQVWGTSRKYAVPLLEELDRRGVTRRRGDLREVPSARPRPAE